MNDIKRTILWVIFGFSMVLLWDQWQVFNGKKPMFFPQKENIASPNAAITKNNSNAETMATHLNRSIQ